MELVVTFLFASLGVAIMASAAVRSEPKMVRISKLQERPRGRV